MGIVRVVEWKLACSPEEADSRLRDALGTLDMSPEGAPGSIHAKSSRSLRKNRWAAEVAVNIQAANGASMAVTRVDMLGNKHYALLDELAEALGDEFFDDRGVGDAVDRLGRMGRVFGRKEVRHLHHLLRGNEHVSVLGQGKYGDKQGLVVLTNERLFFFEKSLLGQETVEEFSLNSISALGTAKKRTGERLIVHASGNQAEITNMPHGQADEIVRQFRDLERAKAAESQPAAAPQLDPLAQLERLATLRERGIISDGEFEQKKTELMERI